MNRKEIHGQINVLLEKLSMHNKALSSNEGNLSVIETDLLKHQCLALYDLINHLHYLTLNDSQVDIEKEPRQPLPEVAIHQKEEELLLPETQAIVETNVAEPTAETDHLKIEETLPEIIEAASEPDQPILKEKPVQADEPVTEIIPNEFDTIKFEPIKEKAKPAFTPIAKPEVKEKVILDKLGDKPQNKTLHEKMANRLEEEKEHRFAGLKLNKITDAIDIGKRFELQNNLFGGNNQNYTQGITALENATSKFSALDVFNELSEKYKWDLEGDLVIELKNLIYRKF